MALWSFASSSFGRRVGFYVCLFLFALLATLLALSWHVEERLNQTLTTEPEHFVELQSGETYQDLLRKLQTSGWLKSTWQAHLYAGFSGRADYLQAGEYEVSGRSLRHLLQAMRTGQVRQYYFQLSPGWRWSDIHQALLSEANLDYRLRDMPSADLPAAIGLKLPFLEGAFFPDTYAYTKGAPARVLLRAAHAKMIALLDETWAKRAHDLPIHDPHEALILASIIEKETALDQDRSMISAVLANRLRQNMKLEVDPTVIFGLGQQFDGDLTRTHLITPGPYNTYTNKGLPPTPIALPGRVSLMAALQPADSSALFFVARGDGSSEFSKTRAAHESAVRKYQLKQKSQPQK